MVTRLITLVLLGSVLTGCRFGAFTVRDQELCCPTDVRQKHCWCWGEDALFDTPCGVDEAYHGHKPTCWREWDAPAAVWRDEFCGTRAGVVAPCASGACQTGVVPGSVMSVNAMPHSDPTIASDGETVLTPEPVAPAEVAPATETPAPVAPTNTVPSYDTPAPVDALPTLPSVPQSRRSQPLPSSPRRYTQPTTVSQQASVATPAATMPLPSDEDLTGGPLPETPALEMPSNEPAKLSVPKEEFKLRIIQEAGYTPANKSRSSRSPYGFDFVK